MADKVQKVTWQVDVSDVKKATKAQADYNKELQKMQQRQTGIMRASQRADQGFREQARAAGEAADELGRQAQASQTAAQSTQESTQASERNTQAVQQNVSATQAVIDQNRKSAAAFQKQRDAVKKSSASIGKNIKQMAFWAIGAASVFRLVQKVRRAFLDTVKTLFENTEEYKNLQKAQDRLKVSFVAATGSADDWLKRIDKITDAINAMADGITRASATVSGFNALLRQTGKDQRGIVDLTRAFQSFIRGDIGKAVTEVGFAVGRMGSEFDGAKSFLDAYNAKMADAEELQDRFSVVSMKSARSLDEQKDRVDDLAKAHVRLGKLQDALADAQKRRLEDLADLERERIRRLQDINTELQRDLADVALKGSRKREDIEIAFRRRIEDLERSRAAQRLRIEERLRLKLLRIELRFREQMIRIRENFDDSLFEAIMKRDATAALMAIRRRTRDEGRARRERANAITLANAEAQSARRIQAQSAENQRQAAILARQRALEDLARDLARERQDIQTNHDREMEDLNIFLQRRRDDIEMDYQRRLDRARQQYKQEETDYQAHLDRQHQKLQSHIARTNAELTKLQLAQALGLTGTGVSAPSVKTSPDFGAARGGDATFTRPTTIGVAERGRPERVTVQPLSSAGGSTFNGTMRHQISGSIEAAMDGFAGRLGPMISDQIVSVMGDMLN